MLDFNVKCTLKLCGIFTLISIAIFTSLISMISIFKNIFIYGRLQLQNKKELNNNSKVKYNKYKEYYINTNATIKNLLTLIKNENLKLSFPFLLTK